MPFSRMSSQPRSPTLTLQADSLPAEPQGKPKNTGVGSPSSVYLPDPGIEPGSPELQVDSLSTELSGKPFRTWKMPNKCGMGYISE